MDITTIAIALVVGLGIGFAIAKLLEKGQGRSPVRACRRGRAEVHVLGGDPGPRGPAAVDKTFGSNAPLVENFVYEDLTYMVTEIEKFWRQVAMLPKSDYA